MKKKLLIAAFVGIPLVAACTNKTVVQHDNSATEPTDPAAGADAAAAVDPAPAMDAGKDADITSTSKAPEDRCLDGQSMDGADVDITKCPDLPSAPDTIDSAAFTKTPTIDLGAWEMGTLPNGATYQYGTLSAPGTNPRMLKYETGSVAVNDLEVQCWAKSYYRLRKILQNPPAEYVKLRNAGFQYRFFQFQSDLRNGPTGYQEISSFEDHLVKWVSVITKAGVCVQPTLTKFRAYAQDELTTRGIK